MSQYPATIALSGLNGVTGFSLSGANASDFSGASVAAAGDVNGDGFADLIVGAYYASGHNGRSGAAYVVFGAASGFAPNLDLSALNGSNGFKLAGETTGDWVGHSVASAGDVNGDGFPDLIVGAQDRAAGAGSSYVVFGHAPGFAAVTNLSGLDGTTGFRLDGAPQDTAGISVASAGDINGDGYADQIVGAFGFNQSTSHSGAAYVVFGKASGFAAVTDLSTLDGTTGFRLTGAAGDYAGYSVASAGDVNGDGFVDLLVGALRGGGGAGDAYVVFGHASGFAANLDLSTLTGTNGFEIVGEASGDLAGFSVASAGDVNGDGYADMIIGAQSASPQGHKSGAAYVVFGKAAGFPANINLSSLTGADGFRISGAGLYDYAGRSVASAGDVNGDGFDDVVVGAFDADINGTRSGAAYVVFGKASGFAANIDLAGLDGTSGFRLDGAALGDATGIAVSGAGDINGDGLPDLIVGADQADPHGSVSGSSYVVLGRLPDAAVTRTGTADSQHLVGGNFADVLSGGGGNDRLYGNGGNDLLVGGPGNDSFIGSSGTDAVSYQAALAGVTVSLLLTTPQNTLGAGVDTLTGVEKLVGSAFADTLTAGAAGSTLNGGPGADVLIGGPGSDILNGGGAMDTADYSLATAGVSVSLAIATFQNTVSAGSDQLVSIENLAGSGFGDTLTGDAGANTLSGLGGGDTINGGANADTLSGGAGNDVLNGGAGQDSLTGGTGNDAFVFAALSDTLTAHPDRITDFASGDKIDLHLIDANAVTAGDQAFRLGGGGGHAGDIVVKSFDAGNNRTEVDLYVDNNASIDAAIWLTGNHAGLTATDFVL